MKKLLLTLFIVLTSLMVQPALAQSPPQNSAEGSPQDSAVQSKAFNVILAGGDSPNVIEIWLTPDGRSYVIDSAIQLEVGGAVCTNPEGNPNELICPAPMISGFEVNAGVGADKVSVAKNILLPVTLRGGAGDDVLAGGAGADKLVGGPGDDQLSGGAGIDAIFGGPGKDTLLGGPGDDQLIGGPGRDVIVGGPGHNEVRPFQ
ncbi:MAG: hypothetical protein WBM00_10570 [Solirubrobacterales bacterium]